MDLFDKINSFAKSATEKTENMIETSKLNSKISAEERNISAITLKIGEYFISKMDNGEELDSEAMSMYESIKNCRNNIEGFRNEIAVLNIEKTVAPSEPTTVFTPSEDEYITCPLCGAKMPSNAKFCTVCGAQLPENKTENC